MVGWGPGVGSGLVLTGRSYDAYPYMVILLLSLASWHGEVHVTRVLIRLATVGCELLVWAAS